LLPLSKTSGKQCAHVEHAVLLGVNVPCCRLG
jgi:hypothetical protein